MTEPPGADNLLQELVTTWRARAAHSRGTGRHAAGNIFDRIADDLAQAATAGHGVDSGRVAAALGEVAALGHYFAVATDVDARWRPLSELDGPAFAALVATARDRLQSSEDRVAASILFQGIASRLWSPVLGTAVSHRVVPDLPPERTYWRPYSPGPILLALLDPTGRPYAADTLHQVVVDRLRPLVATTQSVTRVATGLLWGNAAASLAGAARAIIRVRPELAPVVREITERVLAIPPFRGTGNFVRPDPRPAAWFFVRRSCCLYYRLPGGEMCGDCALLDPATRRREWQQTLETWRS